MDNPEILETLVTQDTGHTIGSSILSNVYLLPIVCPVSCVTNVSSISGLSILDCLSVLSNVYLLPIACSVSGVINFSNDIQ
jgi:hypothetical protein